MAKRDRRTGQANSETAGASGAATTDSMEQRLLDFAEQLGRMVGTIHAKTEGWRARENLNRQIARVRDGAAHLLEQLADSTKATKTPTDVAPLRGSKGRSGGAVDAPGKRRRKPTPNALGASTVRSQADKVRAAKTMQKTNRRRGRG